MKNRREKTPTERRPNGRNHEQRNMKPLLEGSGGGTRVQHSTPKKEENTVEEAQECSNLTPRGDEEKKNKKGRTGVLDPRDAGGQEI